MTMNPKLLLLAAVVLGLGIGHVHAKRAAPKKVTPVISGGVMYSAPLRGRGKGEQNGGFIEAVDLDTGKLLWELKVYQIKIDSKLERDVQEIYITSLELVKGNLEVMNEAGDKFVVDLAKRKVISGAGRVYRFKDDTREK